MKFYCKTACILLDDKLQLSKDLLRVVRGKQCGVGVSEKEQ